MHGQAGRRTGTEARRYDVELSVDLRAIWDINLQQLEPRLQHTKTFLFFFFALDLRLHILNLFMALFFFFFIFLLINFDFFFFESGVVQGFKLSAYWH